MDVKKAKNIGGADKSNTKKNFSVLIVDDDRVIRMINNASLKRLGVEIKEAENGLKAVELFRAGEVFDLVIMDRDMPVMNGPQATRELRAMGVTSMIVGLTACTEEEREQFMKAGLDDCFEKPLKLKKITSILQALDKAAE